MKKIVFVICLLLLNSALFSQDDFATVTKRVENAANYKGKEFKLSAYFKTDTKSDSKAHLWIRVDKENKKTGFFENMEKNPIKTNNWKQFEIKGKIDIDAKEIYFGGYIIGKGFICIDKFKFEVKNDKGEWEEVLIKNNNFEEKNPNQEFIFGWICYSESHKYIYDSINPYEGKYAVKIEKINEEENKTIKEIVKNGIVVTLPIPKYDGNTSVEKAMYQRRSIREYVKDSLSIDDISQMLWAAWGVNDSNYYQGFYLRTTPSAGALYPFEVYMVVGAVKGLEAGVYKYYPVKHAIKMVIKGDIRKDFCKAAYSQTFIKKAPASIFWTAIYERTTSKYGNRGRERYVCMDLGHSAQNVYLQAESLELGTCAIAAFEDKKIIELFELPKEEEPLYIMPFGKLKEKEKQYKANKK